TAATWGEAEIHCVLVEVQQRQLSGFQVQLLAIAAPEDDARSGFAPDQVAAFRHQGHALRTCGSVVNQDSPELSVLVYALDVESDAVPDRAEDPGLSQHCEKVVPDRVLQILEGSCGGRR